MEVIKKITMDLSRRILPVEVDAVQGDSGVYLEFTVFSNGEPWELPVGAAVMVRYRTGAGTGGEYDTVNGARAWEKEGNILRITLAPQVCSAPGETQVQVAILQGGTQISTFPVLLQVSPAVTGSGEPENYTNLAQWLKYNTTGSSMNLGEIEDRIIALEAASATHVTEAQVRQIIANDPWDISVYGGEMEDV